VVVLVVERDPGVAELARRCLERAGFDVVIENDPGRAVAVAARLRPAVVLLELAPGTPPDLYRRVSAATGTAPVVCLIPAGQQVEAGVPRLARPFAPRVLVDTVAAVVRQAAGGDAPDVLRAGAVCLDPRTRTVAVADEPVTVTATEFDLLEFLMRHPGRVFTREQLLEAAWDPAAGVSTGAGGRRQQGAGSRTIDVHIAQLRSKLGPASPIRTVRGVGYAVDS
jgi:DNA-binding response OmpR family regulator